LLEKTYPGIDFSPLFVSEESINNRISEHKAAFIAYKESQLKKAGIPLKSQKERVDEIMKKGLTNEIKDLIDEKNEDYQFIRDPKIQEEKIGRISDNKFTGDAFINQYMKKEKGMPEKHYLDYNTQQEKMQIPSNIDPSVKHYITQIMQNTENTPLTLESYMNKKDNQIQAQSKISNPEPEKITSKNIFDGYYKMLGKAALNSLSPKEYYEYFDKLLARNKVDITLDGENYLKPSDKQKIFDDMDLLARHMTGGESLTNILINNFEKTNKDEVLLKVLKNEQLDSDEENLLEENEKKLKDPIYNNPLMRFVLMKEAMEREYYFDPSQGESLESHIAKIKSVPGVSVTYSKGNDGLYIIKKKLQLPFKYHFNDIGKITQESLKEEAYKRLDRLISGITPDGINKAMQSFGFEIMPKLSETMKKVSLGVNIPQLDEETKEKIWDVLSMKADGEISADELVNELMEIGKKMIKTGKTQYVDANIISETITNLGIFYTYDLLKKSF